MTVQELRKQEPTFLQKANRTGYICPECGNGSGADGDGIVTKNGIHYHCFKCGLHGDIIDLIGIHYSIEDPKEKFDKAHEFYGVERQKDERGQKRTKTPGKQEIKEDYSAFYEEAMKNNDFSYLQARGISEETQKKFRIGFAEKWVSPQAVKTTLEKGGNPEKLPTSPRCIIPRDNHNYLARDTRRDLTDEQRRFEKQNQGQTSLFNIEALKESKQVFIVEGEIDAMSVHEAGGVAIGLCSVSNRKTLTDHLSDNYAGQVFILMLDNDDAGRKGQKELAEALNKLEIPFIEAEYASHDPNDALREDREGLESLISSLQADAQKLEVEVGGNQFNAGELLDYFKTIEEQPEGFEAPTGFKELDRLLFGGIHEGLYIIGAISSLGKTTFVLQMADQIAESGQDVIFFSLEMSKYELMAKSISRHTYKMNRDAKTPDGRYIARDTVQVLNNRRYKDYSKQEREAITQGIQAYSKQAGNLYIYEGRYKGERLKVSHIRQIVKRHVEMTGRRPVVFVDYLQIIAPEDVRMSDKQNTDSNVFELKEISRDFSIPVFAISSFNRENYLEPVSMTSFKESGAVEYSSDILFGLQYAGMDYREGDSEKKRKERIRDLTEEVFRKKRNKEPIEVELKCLKNRNGYQFTTTFRMIPAFNFFEEIYGQEAFRSQMGIKEKKIL